jgi:2,5-furandicarboxylate decarboxylase 1
MDQDLRSVMARFEASGDLVRVSEALDGRHEIAAALTLNPRGPALLFDHVKGHRMAVIGNVLNTRRKYALSLNIEEKETFSRTVHGLTHPLDPVLVAQGPCQEKVFTRDIDLAAALPLPHLCEKDRNPYVSAGVLVGKDPDTGIRNVSMNRLQITGPNEALVGMAPSHHLFQLLKKAEMRGEKLPVAIAVGNHPALHVGANMYVDLGFDEFGIVGGLFGEPLRLVRAKTVDIEVPAGSEIVIEGEIDPKRWAEEGPFGEFSGIYESYGKAPMMRVTALTMRENPVFQMIMSSRYAEHTLTGAIAIEATVFQTVRRAIPGLREVVITEGGCGRLHMILSLGGARPGEGKKAILAAFAALNLGKLAIAIDDDIDPRDPVEVERAIATRMRADRDVVIIPGVKTDRAEPLEAGMTVAKMGIDATRPHDIPPEVLEEADVPAAVKARVAAKLKKIVETPSGGVRPGARPGITGRKG